MNLIDNQLFYFLFISDIALLALRRHQVVGLGSLLISMWMFQFICPITRLLSPIFFISSRDEANGEDLVAAPKRFHLTSFPSQWWQQHSSDCCYNLSFLAVLCVFLDDIMNNRENSVYKYLVFNYLSPSGICLFAFASISLLF